MGAVIERMDHARHFRGVARLLRGGNVEPPREPADMAGPGFVAVNQHGEIVGCIWALAREGCSRAYVDYWAVREDYRGTRLFLDLVASLDRELQAMGVKRYMFHIEKWNHYVFQGMFKHRERFNLKLLAPLHTILREMVVE